MASNQSPVNVSGSGNNEASTHASGNQSGNLSGNLSDQKYGPKNDLKNDTYAASVGGPVSAEQAAIKAKGETISISWKVKANRFLIRIGGTAGSWNGA